MIIRSSISVMEGLVAAEFKLKKKKKGKGLDKMQDKCWIKGWDKIQR